MKIIIPAVLERNEKELKKRIKIAESISKRIQIDVADGKFVKNRTVALKVIEKLKPNVKTEFHLMVHNPDKYINVLADKADIIAIHCEIPNLKKFIDKIKSKKIKAAVAINPKTNIKKLLPVINKVNKVIVLTVFPGWQGNKFIPMALKKIKQIKKANPKVIVQVDGGINEKTIALAEKAGADEFVIGSALVKTNNPKEEYRKLIK